MKIEGEKILYKGDATTAAVYDRTLQSFANLRAARDAEIRSPARWPTRSNCASPRRSARSADRRAGERRFGARVALEFGSPRCRAFSPALKFPRLAPRRLASARGGVYGARWIEPSDYHITLRFIGDVDLRAARDVADALADIRRPPVCVNFEGLSWFGADKPRAIVAKIKPTAPLIDLQSEQERRLRRIGLRRTRAISRRM